MSYRKARNNMAEYHVGAGVFGIYAGTLNKKGNMWLNKSDVTDEAIRSVAEFLLMNNESLIFTIRGKKYRLHVTDINVGKIDESEDAR